MWAYIVVKLFLFTFGSSSKTFNESKGQNIQA